MLVLTSLSAPHVAAGLVLFAFDEIRAIACKVSGYEIRAVSCRISDDKIASALRPGVWRIARRLSKCRNACEDSDTDKDNFTHFHLVVLWLICRSLRRHFESPAHVISVTSERCRKQRRVRVRRRLSGALLSLGAISVLSRPAALLAAIAFARAIPELSRRCYSSAATDGSICIWRQGCCLRREVGNASCPAAG